MPFLLDAGYWHAPIRLRLGYVLVSLRTYASFLGLEGLLQLVSVFIAIRQIDMIFFGSSLKITRVVPTGIARRPR